MRMNACEVILIPNCTVAQDRDFSLCDYFEEAGNGSCVFYLGIPTDFGEFHRCGCTRAIEEAVYAYAVNEPEPDVDPLKEQEDFAQDDGFFSRTENE